MVRLKSLGGLANMRLDEKTLGVPNLTDRDETTVTTVMPVYRYYLVELSMSDDRRQISFCRFLVLDVHYRMVGNKLDVVPG